MSDELKELKAKLNKAAEIHNDSDNPYCYGCPYQKKYDCAESMKADYRRALALIKETKGVEND